MGSDALNRTAASGLEGTPYRFVREIGRGGMGSVHEVEHRALGKIFVMKVLHGSLAHRDDFALRMKREWRTLARLEHPAIVRVTDAGQTAEGLPFFVMERLEGQTLGEALRARGRFGAAEAVRLVSVVLSGLEVAHRAGAIHRDIKPQNLFLTAEGPKILDFGIVKSMRRGGAFVTQSGMAIGTPRYMAPEQAAGFPVDGRADVYACGLVLFEMIAGQDPFSHLKDQAALVNAQVSEVPVRLDDLCSAPAPLADVLARFLAKDPADRPASARLAQLELAALLPLLEGEGAPLTPAEPASLARLRHEDESTAGTSGLSHSLPPSASFEFSAPAAPVAAAAPVAPAAPAVPAGRPEVAFGPTDSFPAAEPPEAGEPRRSPSVTPPPLARPDSPLATPTGARQGSRWAAAALVLLTASTVGVALVVLQPSWLRQAAPAAGEAALGRASFDFPIVEPLGPSAPDRPPRVQPSEVAGGDSNGAQLKEPAAPQGPSPPGGDTPDPAPGVDVAPAPRSIPESPPAAPAAPAAPPVGPRRIAVPVGQTAVSPPPQPAAGAGKVPDPAESTAEGLPGSGLW